MTEEAIVKKRLFEVFYTWRFTLNLYFEYRAYTGIFPGVAGAVHLFSFHGGGSKGRIRS